MFGNSTTQPSGPFRKAGRLASVMGSSPIPNCGDAGCLLLAFFAGADSDVADTKSFFDSVSRDTVQALARDLDFAGVRNTESCTEARSCVVHIVATEI